MKFGLILYELGGPLSNAVSCRKTLPIAVELFKTLKIFKLQRKKPYISVQRMGELAKKLPAPAFVRCHREFIVNLNRARSITPRDSRDYDLRMDPPVNRRIPVARSRMENLGA